MPQRTIRAQPPDADLTAIAALATTGTIERTGAGTVNTYTVSSQVRTALAGSSPLATLDPVSGRLPFSQLSTEVLGAAVFKGVWNPSTNTPTLVNGGGGLRAGDYYVCSADGVRALDGVGGADDPWTSSDVVIFDGTVWRRIDARDAVRSVNGQIGAVSLTAANVGAEPAFTTLSDTKLGDRSADDTLTPSTLGPGTLTQWLGWITNRIKAITGGASWFTAPATTLATTATHISRTDNPHSVTSAQIFSASQAANAFFGAPNGSAGAPSFRALAAADIPLATSTLRGAVSREVAGTFAPLVQGTTVAGAQSYSSSAGQYYLVGKICVASFNVLLSAKDVNTQGDVRIGGLPFVSNASVQQSAAVSLFSGVSLNSGYTQLGARVEPNTTHMSLIQVGSNVNVLTLPSTNISGSFWLTGTVAYVIA